VSGHKLVDVVVVQKLTKAMADRDGGKVSLGPPRTKNSRRTVGLTDGAVEALREHLTRQLEEMERVGSLYRPGGLVFANEVGGIINPSNLRNRSLRTLLKRAGLPAIRFHDLRHTCATLLLSRNVDPKMFSEMLGHSSIAITLDTYSPICSRAPCAPSKRPSSNGRKRVAARLLHEGPGYAPGPSLVPRFYLQNVTFLTWACLDSNQGPLPYQRQKHMPGMFTVVQKYLQNGLFFIAVVMRVHRC
jgi:hypothetical protein